MMDLFRHLRIHTQKKPEDGPEEMDFPEMYLLGTGATTELPDNFKRKKTMNCYHCETELVWGGDQDIEEEFDHEDAHKMVTNLNCPNCATFYLVYTPKTFFDKEKYNAKKND